MPHSFASLLVPIVFSTKNRASDLSPQLAARLFPYMAGIVRARKGLPLIVNGPADHVPLLACVSATESMADLLRVVKANSSRWVHEQFPEHEGIVMIQTGRTTTVLCPKEASSESQLFAH